ncbi:hypothetical protein HY256_00180, partial [Candidatus Sumerlaeota bacterium]|nr:hypothetical protein [Candidatus Sumerlaeota bacterium]
LVIIRSVKIVPPEEAQMYEAAQVLSRLHGGSPRRCLDLARNKLIILSDQHRGTQDGADDFLACKPAYHAALDYYLAAGHHLILLGDVEELWECRPSGVLASYRDTLQLEAQFLRAGGYTRLFGNHDLIWSAPSAAIRYLQPWIGYTEILESLRMEVREGKDNLGELFLLHGHQGTLTSDRFARLSEWLVRYGWGFLQRISHWRSTSPTTDFELRAGHERRLYDWAAALGKTILIAGHTHHPVFVSESHARFTARKLAEAILADDAEAAGQLKASLDMIHSRDGTLDATISMARPCYFNTGCCCFSDGDITGIEIADGEIRLVRWPDDNGKAKPKILRSASLRSVFIRIRFPE